MGDGVTWAEAVPAVVSVLGAVGSLWAWIAARRDAKKDAIERRTEAQAEAERMSALVQAAQEHADRAAQVAAALEDQASSAARSATGMESIASALSPSRLSIEWQSHTQFRLRNSTPAPVLIESFTYPRQFVRLPFEVPVKVTPDSSIPGLAMDAHGRPFPGELVLDIVGEDEPVVVPISGRPARS